MPEGNGSADDGLHGDQLQDWLDSLLFADPVVAARSLAEKVRRIRKSDLSVRSRMKLLDMMREKTEMLLPVIEQRLAHAALPLPVSLQATVVNANQLLKELGAAYAATASALTGKWYPMNFKRTLRLAVFHGMRVTARRLALASRIYARGSRSAWQKLHGLYRIARNEGFATRALAESGDTVERIYIRALLLAFAEPNKFAAGDIDRVEFYLQRHGHLARLSEPPHAKRRYEPDSASFLVRPGDPGPGRSLLKSPDGPYQPGDLILQCAPLVERLHDQVQGLVRKTVPAKLGLPKIAEQPQYLAMLRSLMVLWAAPPARRFARARFQPRVDLVVGFLALWNFVAGAAYRRRSGDERPASDASQGALSEWRVANESPDGFALRYVAGNVSLLRVREILGVRPRDSATIYLCISRRAVADALTSVELGAQVLGSNAQPATITLPATAPVTTQRIARVILIPRMPGMKNQPGLLAPPGCVEVGAEFTLPYRGERAIMRIDERLEKLGSCELFVLTLVAHPRGSAA